jgi:prepilin-type N-terminal cleavage/methylation domain-containing protein
MRAASTDPRARSGFTLIELMVVVAIVIMAMGLMAPTLIEFFKNQKLKSVRSHFTSALERARLISITKSTTARVVFFKEGVRVYNTKERRFPADEDFTPESSPGAATGITFKLEFAGMDNSQLLEYRKWEATQPNLNKPPSAGPEAGTCTLDDPNLPMVEFQRDGSVRWLKGDDVPSSRYTADPPGGDIIVEQAGNPEALYIDIRNTGSIKSKFDKAPSP